MTQLSRTSWTISCSDQMVQVRTQRAPKLVLLFLPCMYMHMYNIECFGHAMSCLITEVILIVGNASIKNIIMLVCLNLYIVSM